MIKYCGTAEKRRKILELQHKIKNTIKIMEKDLELLGEKRVNSFQSI